MTVRMTLELPDDLDAAIVRMAEDIRTRGRPALTPEGLAVALLRIGIGAATAEAIDGPAVLDRLGQRVVELFVRGVFR